MDTVLEFGLDTKVTGIQNAMVAQCAWFLDGHIQALRNHWQRKVEEAEKKCEAQLIAIKGELGCLQEELEAVEKERDELKIQTSELLKERLAPQAIEYVKNGVPLDRFNEVVMELSKMRDERDELQKALQIEIEGRTAQERKENELVTKCNRLADALKAVVECDPKDAFATANTLANHGNVRFDDPEVVSTGIFRVCNAVAEAKRIANLV